MGKRAGAGAPGIARVGLGIALACVAWGAAGATPKPEAAAGSVIVLTVDGIIDPVTARYLERQFERAERDRAALVVLRLDTPGGLDASMRGITKRMVNSPVPSAVYVAPSGSRAASAGAFIGMAANVLAMASGTNLGAAHPVDLQGKQASEKITNDAAAYMAGLARLRGRPQVPAVEMVRASASYPAEDAVRIGLADMEAAALDALVAGCEGRTVRQAGRTMTLRVAGRPRVERPMAWTESFLHALTNPNLAYVLFLIGIYGMIYELAAPGAILPGVAGAICLLLALMGFEGLPVSLAGILMLALGACLLVLEIFIVSHGILGAGGVAALILGSFMLLPSDLPTFRIARSVLWTMTSLSAAFVAALVFVIIRNRRPGPALTGTESLIASRGQVKSVSDHEIIVHIRGEEWSAVSDQPLVPGQTVEVVAVEGLFLRVKPV